MSTAKSTVSFGKVFRVLQKNTVSQPYSLILEHRQHESALLFESNAIALLSGHEFESIKKQYTKIQDAYGCLGIMQYSYGDNVILYLVTVTGCVSVGKLNDNEIYRVTQTAFLSLRNQPQDEDYISDVKKLLNSGTFYFSRGNSLDITLCAQRYRKNTISDNRFFWNRMLHIYFIRFEIDVFTWLLKIMCGSVEIRTVYVRHKQARAAIISRLSCERTGTRFNVRGCNDDGHVANFVETEQTIYLETKVTSYLQTRGSVPLFWEQPGVQVGAHKVKLSRGLEAAKAAYDKHFDSLKKRYANVVVVNLLSSVMVGSRESEANLSHMFQNHHISSKHSNIPLIVFDYHAECKSGNARNMFKLKEQVESYVSKFGLFYADGNLVMNEQKGVFRVNCLDCLDRTNCVQTVFGLELLDIQLSFLGENETQMLSRFEETFRQMWVNNGNEISKIYAGTGAIQGGSTLMDGLMDGARSAARTIQNNLLDNSKQEAIDILLLGNSLNSELADRSRMYLPTHYLYTSTAILRETCKRFREFTEPSLIRVAVGTYNVNGGKHFRSLVYKDLSLSDWLLDAVYQTKLKSLIDSVSTAEDDLPVDIFAIGFEEIVDLNASNIMAASSENATLWAEELQKVLCRDYHYVLLTYHQLVGVCLYVFVRASMVEYIKDVAIDCVKTGLRGATGNKGAVGIRFVLHSSSLCFVCSHFAAGQSQVQERNADYAEIVKKLSFPMGRTLFDHDYIFWCGDFNYRVDMDKDTMKELIKNNMLDDVLQHDQLILQRKENKVFHEFNEGEITFAPTYKYDLFSDDYDTSEKCRAPAWTDRVLWMRHKLYQEEDQTEDWHPGKLIYYGRAELKQSDHRPVIAILEIQIRKLIAAERDRVFSEVLKAVGPLDGTIILQLEQVHADFSTIFDDDALKNELLCKLSQYGKTILVRFVEDTMWVTYAEGVSVLRATATPYIDVQSYRLRVTKKTSDWVNQTLKEINVCADNTTPLYEPVVDAMAACAIQVPSAPRTPTKAPARPPRPKAAVISIPANLHEPLQPTKMDSSLQPTIPDASAAPPVPRRQMDGAPPPSMAPPVLGAQPPPIPARPPPIPPR